MRRARPQPSVRHAGRVVASHGPRVVVETAGGERLPCRLFGRDLQVVCGDRVAWSPAAAEGAAGLVLAIEPRRNELARIDAAGRSEVVVANLDRLLAVVAPIPAADFSLCDRYLAAAEWAGIEAAVVLNKADLPAAADATLQAELSTYRGLGYAVVTASREHPTGTALLTALLSQGTSVLVGQSGVGKSSLTNRLVPGVEAVVREVSRATEEGRHTTTASTLFRMPQGGELIDSPGVRDFAPPLPEPRHVASGFREILAAGTDCRFQDCLHRGEPACAVERAAAAGAITARRLGSYRQLLRLSGDIEQKQRDSGRPTQGRQPRGGVRR